MDDRLTAFLQYDYGQAQEVGKALLTTFGVALGVGVVFADKFIRLGETDRSPILKLSVFGLYALCAATIFASFGLIINYTNMLDILHRFQAGIPDGARFVSDVAQHNLGVSGALWTTGCSLAAGLFCLLKGIYDGSPARRPKVEPASEE